MVTETLSMVEHSIDNSTATSRVARETAAERMGRCRARRRAGFRCFTVEIHRTEIDALVCHGLLRVDDREDDGAVGDALSQHIEQTLGSAS